MSHYEIPPIGYQVMQSLIAMLVFMSIWAFLYALRIVGVKPESLTQRIIARFRRKPIDSVIMAFFFFGFTACGATKGPIIRPPIAVHTIPIWRNPVDGFLWPVWRRYRLQMIQQAPIIPKEPEGEEGDE